MNLSALLPVAVVLALAACGAAQQAPIQPIATPINVPPTSSASASAQVPPKRAESTTLRLIIAGAVPRRVVRYRFSATQSEIATIELRTSHDVDADRDSEADAKHPVLRLKIAVEPRQLTSDADLHYDYRLAASEVLKSKGTRPETTAVYETVLAELRGLAGTGVVSSHGVSSRLTIVRPKTAPALSDGLITHILQMMRDLHVPFPDQEIGAGARWAAITTTGDAEDEMMFALVESTGDAGKVEITVRHVVADSTVSITQGDVTISDLVCRGSGSAAFNLGRVVSTSTLSSVTTMKLTRDDKGKRDTALMTMRVTSRISGSVR